MNLFRWLFPRRKEPAFDLPPEFMEEDAPDWVIALEGKELPQGKEFSVRVLLSEASRTGTTKLGRGSVETAGPDLARPEIDRLLVILGFSFPDDITNVGAGETDDGLPVHITIYRQEPSAMRAATCNMAGWVDSKKSGPPAIEIGRALLEVQRRAMPVA
jgi:hypothetical protein